MTGWGYGWREKWIARDVRGYFVKEVGGGWGITHGPYRWWIIAAIVYVFT